MIRRKQYFAIGAGITGSKPVVEVIRQDGLFGSIGGIGQLNSHVLHHTVEFVAHHFAGRPHTKSIVHMGERALVPFDHRRVVDRLPL